MPTTRPQPARPRGADELGNLGFQIRMPHTAVVSLSMFFCVGFCLCQQLVEFYSIQKAPVDYHGSDLLRVANVFERVGVEYNQIGGPSFLHSSQGILQPQEARGIAGGCLQGLHWSEPGFSKQSQLIMQAEPWVSVGRTKVSTSHERNTCLIHTTHYL